MSLLSKSVLLTKNPRWSYISMLLNKASVESFSPLVTFFPDYINNILCCVLTTGAPPLVIAHGGFSGLFPDSSLKAYKLALDTSLPNSAIWCDVQLSKDGFGICFPDLKMRRFSNVNIFYPNRTNTYPVNEVPSHKNWFTIDFSLRYLTVVSVIQGKSYSSRSTKFDGNEYMILKVEDVYKDVKPDIFWLNVQHKAFYAEHNLSMSSFLVSASKTSKIDFISSPENFASGILVPKSYILPVDKGYLLPHTSLVQDAHKVGLEVYVSGFANDIQIAYDYSDDPVSEYLSFVDNGNFTVDGVLSDFPITASSSIVDFLVITKNGASGDYPGCTDLAYDKAIRDGADVIDCSVQMSSDGTPFCLSSIDLSRSTTIVLSSFRNRSTIVPEISSSDGIYSFSLTWPEIKTLTPSMSHSFRIVSGLLRNPRDGNSGKLLSLYDFLNLAKNATSLSGVLINVQNVAYLREKQGLDVVKAVLDTLTKTGYRNSKTTKVMIQSTNSSVLVDFKKQSRYYQFVYKVEETIRDILDSAIEEIKTFANAVVVGKESVFPLAESFVTGQTNLVARLRKYDLPVYVELFQNEFLSQPFDFFRDANYEINSYITGPGINGTITEFPLTAARYIRNRCLARKELPPYMALAQPGWLLGTITSHEVLPPALAPNPVFSDSDLAEPPLPPVTAKSPTSTPGSPSANATPPSGQTRPTLSLLLSASAMFIFYLCDQP
ncbi:unnamed protein product [Cochlearia groenlandica]